MEARFCSKTPVDFQRTTLRYTEDRMFRKQCCESLRSGGGVWKLLTDDSGTRGRTRINKIGNCGIMDRRQRWTIWLSEILSSAPCCVAETSLRAVPWATGLPVRGLERKWRQGHYALTRRLWQWRCDAVWSGRSLTNVLSPSSGWKNSRYPLRKSLDVAINRKMMPLLRIEPLSYRL